MKIKSIVFAAFVVLFLGCSKDENEDPTSTSSYYLDVTFGGEKLLWNANANVTTGYAAAPFEMIGTESNGFDYTDGATITNINTLATNANLFRIGITKFYTSTNPTCAEFFGYYTPGEIYKFINAGSGAFGAVVIFQDENGDYWDCLGAQSSSNNMEIIESNEVNVAGASRAVKIKFTVNLYKGSEMKVMTGVVKSLAVTGC